MLHSGDNMFISWFWKSVVGVPYVLHLHFVTLCLLHCGSLRSIDLHHLINLTWWARAPTYYGVNFKRIGVCLTEEVTSATVTFTFFTAFVDSI